MPFPETRQRLKESGYDFITTKQCPCGSTMELWHTPKDQIIPMDPMNDDQDKAVSHWATCSKAAQFRKRPVSSPAHGSAPGRTPP